MEGNTCSHNSKTNRKYSGRSKFLKEQGFSPLLTNNNPHIFQPMTHNSNFIFEIFLPKHRFFGHLCKIRRIPLSPSSSKSLCIFILQRLFVILSKHSQKVRIASRDFKQRGWVLGPVWVVWMKLKPVSKG